jgi:hypothetical protein
LIASLPPARLAGSAACAGPQGLQFVRGKGGFCKSAIQADQ